MTDADGAQAFSLILTQHQPSVVLRLAQIGFSCYFKHMIDPGRPDQSMYVIHCGARLTDTLTGALAAF